VEVRFSITTGNCSIEGLRETAGEVILDEAGVDLGVELEERGMRVN
jgi:hypothetical protein